MFVVLTLVSTNGNRRYQPWINLRHRVLDSHHPIPRPDPIDSAINGKARQILPHPLLHQQSDSFLPPLECSATNRIFNDNFALSLALNSDEEFLTDYHHRLSKRHS
jgi:hypothetical protein